MVRSAAQRRCTVRALLILFAIAVPTGLLPAANGSPAAGPSAPIAPSARDKGSMAYDGARGQVVLFGGCCDDTTGSSFGDTWTWDGTGWTRRTPAHEPPPRSAEMMAYDVTRSRTVLFGGCCSDAGDSFGDTWTWNGSDWKLRAPAHSPPPRWGGMIAFDTERRQVVLYGGFDQVAYFDDTWTWDGTDWTERHPAHSPGPLAGGGATWDSFRCQVVVFGGYSYGGPVGDTWTWDGTDWTKRAPAHSPPARSFMGMSFDDGRGQAVLFGGTPQGNEEALEDTWTWDGTDWTQRFPQHVPSMRLGPQMTFDGLRFDTVLFGGFDPSCCGYLGDTWTWDGTDWTTHLDGAIDLDPRSGHPDSFVSVDGRNFAPGELVRLTFIDSTLGVVSIGTAHANAGGAFSELIRVPHGATPGREVVKAKGRSSGEVAKRRFLVT
jgi:hypothetical protein